MLSIENKRPLQIGPLMMMGLRGCCLIFIVDHKCWLHSVPGHDDGD